MSDALEAAAQRLASRRRDDDQERAHLGGCDVMLAIDGYMESARADVRLVLEAIREPILAAMTERRAIYETVAAQRDPLADDGLNRHDMSVFGSEVMDYVVADLSALIDAAVREQS